MYVHILEAIDRSCQVGRALIKGDSNSARYAKLEYREYKK